MWALCSSTSIGSREPIIFLRVGMVRAALTVKVRGGVKKVTLLFDGMPKLLDQAFVMHD